MMSIVLQLLTFLIVLALILVASMWYTHMLINRMVGSKHRDLEEVALTGMIPQTWSGKFERRMIRLQQTGNEVRLEQLRRVVIRTYLRRLSRLSEYVRRTRFVESEEVRKHALRTLLKLDHEWRRAADESVS